jgi:hypothetical protein
MKKKTVLLDVQEDLLIDLKIHDLSASLITEFAEKVVRPYYNGNLNSALKDLISKALSEQEFIQSHITHIRNSS